MASRTAYTTIIEGGARVRVPVAQKVSKEMEVFYNPVMKLNRDITSLLLQTVGEARRDEARGRNTSVTKGIRNERAAELFAGFSIGSPLAGTGVRECRLLVELDSDLIREVAINDFSPDAAKLIKKNIELNEKNIGCEEIEVQCAEASQFLLESVGFTYIDLDPFGSPNPFLDAAVRRLQRGGILAVTATDTSALSGTYPDACRRKYWAEPMRNHLMHEVGLRILARKVQLVGAQHEKALTPIYSYAKDHYMRLFFSCEKQKKAVDALLEQHKFYHYCPSCQRSFAAEENTGNCCQKNTVVAGPVFTGALWDAPLAARMARTNATWDHGQRENQRFLDTIAAEAAMPAGMLGFYHLNLVAQGAAAKRASGSKRGARTKRRMPLKKEALLKRKGVYPTHLEGNALRAAKRELLF